MSARLRRTGSSTSVARSCGCAIARCPTRSSSISHTRQPTSGRMPRNATGRRRTGACAGRAVRPLDRRDARRRHRAALHGAVQREGRDGARVGAHLRVARSVRTDAVGRRHPRGASTRRIDGAGYNQRFLYPRRGGIDLLWRALAAQVACVEVNARVVGIDTGAGRPHRERRAGRVSGGCDRVRAARYHGRHDRAGYAGTSRDDAAARQYRHVRQSGRARGGAVIPRHALDLPAGATLPCVPRRLLRSVRSRHGAGGHARALRGDRTRPDRRRVGSRPGGDRGRGRARRDRGCG